MSTLEVTGLAYACDGALAVRNVSLRVQAGESIALLGANRAGKSTTARMIAGVLTPRLSRSYAGRGGGQADAHSVEVFKYPAILADV